MPKFSKKDLYLSVGALAGIIVYKRFLRNTVRGVM